MTDEHCDFKHLPHSGIQSLVPYKPGKSIEELKREKGLSHIIKLASNENPLGCSPKVMDLLKKISPEKIATYPTPKLHPIMDALAQSCGVSLDQITLGHGSDSLFVSLLVCFALHTGRHMLTHQYAFSTYAIQAKALGVPVRHVEDLPNYSVNMDSLIHAVNDDTGLIFIANPNNPTGILIPQSEIIRLLEHMPSHCLLVLDEAYAEFLSDDDKCQSVALLRRFPNLVITRTFSKAYGLAGLRLGYACSHKDISEILWRFQLPFFISQLALETGLVALNDTDFVKKTCVMNQQGMKQLTEGFQAQGFEMLTSHANFITINSKEDGMILYEKLLNQGIIVRPLHPYGMNQWLRVSIGTQEQNQVLLSALNKILKND